MEYVFGTEEGSETLRTKGITHSDLTGFHEIVREYPDQTITDRFRITRKFRSEEDAEENCYDWYIIDSHYRFTDKFLSDVRPTEQEITDHDLAIIEAEQEITELDLKIWELENALEV